MPLLPILASFLGSIIPNLIFRALSSLGFAYLSYVGIGYLIDTTFVYIKSLFADIPPQVSAILGIAKFDVAFNIVISAILARLLLAGMDKVTGSITDLSLRRRGG